jgi:GWxTD domain-containing protein
MAMTDRDTLMEHIESTWPILTNLERNAVQYTLQDADITIMRQFFYSIWERRNPDDPEGEWSEYAEEVKKVEAAYGTRVLKGYQTDRGRVYLQYGEPNTIVRRHNDLDAYPYEIWHYYKIGRFNNKRLIFYNPDLVTNDFQLLNSDIPGEVRNDQWVLMVLQRNNTFGNVDKNVVDNGASRVLIDLWNNPR